MYEELVEALRLCAKYSKAEDALANAQKAADAIEELQRRLEQALYMPLPRWISVTEQLPKMERKSYWVCTNTGYQCECRWTNNRFGIGELDEWGWSIFDIPQYQKVVAWMPLPRSYEPPKEG